MASSVSKIFTARTNIILYVLLLIITPFLMLQHYLQDAIGMLSDFSLYIGKLRIPIVVAAVIVLAVTMTIYHRRKLTLKKWIVWLIIFSMWLLGQESTDYYLDMPFYQLQHNWHYIAYSIFAFIGYRYFARKKISQTKLIISIYITAMCVSTFDEAMQIFLSSRVFDISDIAKDLWGALMGTLYVLFIYNDSEIYKGWKIRQKSLKEYFKKPLSLLVVLMIATYILLFVSSILAEVEYGLIVIAITIALSFFILIIIHATRTFKGRIIVSIIFGLVMALLAHSLVINFNKNITHNKPGITVYRGIPIPYFDILIFENGGFRLVDKKTFFNQTDIRFLFTKASNILLIGSGEERKPRMGFPEDLESQFVFNNETMKPLQVIILPTEEACQVYNRLRSEGKKVVFIIHNTK